MQEIHTGTLDNQVTTSLTVDQNRLWDSLMAMAQIGALPGGGCCRLALSDTDGKGRDLFVSWCLDAGCEISVDQAGNIYARRAGKTNDVPAVATGSHLDTQPHGGRFDGVYGVLAGLEVIRALNDHHIETELPIDLVVWTNEEAARFHPPLSGSSVFVGNITTEAIHATKTIDGTTVAEDLARIGYLGQDLPGTRRLDSFIEAHIEQGPVLEAENLTIGVVTQIQGARVFTVNVIGEDGHAGTVPICKRKDAMTGTAAMITFLNQLAKNTDEQARMTVGFLQIVPNSISTIPGRVRFTIDMRHPEKTVLDSLDQSIKPGLHKIALEHDLDIKIELNMEKSPVYFDDVMIGLVQAAADRLALPNRRMLSGAGHDAMNLAEVVPTSMIFIPCEKGISHNESENASPSDVAAGANVLLHVMMERAKALI